MSTWAVKNENDRRDLWRVIAKREPPFTATLVNGLPRTSEQNRTFWLWIRELVEQWEGHSDERIRAIIKLEQGVPILRRDNPAFRQSYDKFMLHQEYKDKIDFIMSQDLPITSIMTTKQFAEMLDNTYRTFTERGFALTDPSL